MATATKKVRAARPIGRRARDVSKSASLEFLVFEDNGGSYHWAIFSAGGESLAQSGSFASYDEAAHAGGYVRDGAESARFERRAAGNRPVDLLARREAVAREDSDAGRWLDEGGSFRGEAVAK
jgi:uncharacterized protein YegP (UPF0339 family)